MQQCIDKNDLKTAIYGYEHTSNSWAQAWWETILEIYNKNAEWRKKYIIDTIEREIKKVEEQADNDFFQYALSHQSNYVYYIRLVDNLGRVIWNKIGSTKTTLRKRLTGILQAKYCKENSIYTYEIIGVWGTGEQAPQGLESYFRAKLIKTYGSEKYVQEDRFLIEAPIEQMEKWAEEYLPKL